MNPIYLNRIKDAKASKQKPLVLDEKNGMVLNKPQSWKESLDDPSFSQVNRAKVLAAVQAEIQEEETAEANFAYAQSVAAQTDPVSQHYATLISASQNSPAVFRKSERNSPNRAQLRAATGLSHEQIEGWYIMFEREPMARKLALIDYFSHMHQSHEEDEDQGQETGGTDTSDSEAGSSSGRNTGTTAARPRSSNPRLQAKSKTHHRKDKATRKMMRSTGLS